MQDFTKLPVWRKAHRFRMGIQRLVQSFPPYERYDLTQQLRRSARSIGTNIAEGCGHGGKLDTARFLQMAVGSCSETLDHLIVARSAKYIDVTTFRALNARLTEIRRMLIGFIKAIRGRSR